MFGLVNKSPETAPAAAPAGPLDRLGRRGAAAEQRAEAAASPADRETRLAAAAASLGSAVAPKLRELIGNGVPAGEIARQAGQQALIHFRQQGVTLSPLELRGYVAEVLRPLLPASTFSAPELAPTPVVDPPSATPTTVPLPEPAIERQQVEPTVMPWDSEKVGARADADEKSAGRLSRSKIEQARRTVQPLIMSRIDLAAAVSLPRKELVRQLEGLVTG